MNFLKKSMMVSRIYLSWNNRGGFVCEGATEARWGHTDRNLKMYSQISLWLYFWYTIIKLGKSILNKILFDEMKRFSMKTYKSVWKEYCNFSYFPEGLPSPHSMLSTKPSKLFQDWRHIYVQGEWHEVCSFIFR